MKKKIFYTELSYIFGILLLSLSCAFMVRADFGVSMVVAPAYLLHLKLSEFLPFFSFGMAEYTLQALIILFMIILLKKVKLSYFFSFVTAVIYGVALDGFIALTSLISIDNMALRLALYISGMIICSFSISLLFHSYIPPEAYEMFVKEVSAKFNIDIYKFKTIYDCTSCLLGIVMSFAFFGLWHFEGVKLGTVFCALLNGSMIGISSRLTEKLWTFRDRFDLRKYF